MTKKYPLTYEEYEKKVTELFLKLYSQDKQDMGMERLNELLDEDSQFIEGLYEHSCFIYDNPKIFGDTCKKVFDDYLLRAIPVNTLNMLLGGCF